MKLTNSILKLDRAKISSAFSKQYDEDSTIHILEREGKIYNTNTEKIQRYILKFLTIRFDIGI